MDMERTDAADAYLADAIGGLAAADPALAGGMVSKWLVITEHEFADEPHAILSIFKNDSLSPWARLGMLRFATLITETETDDLYRDEEESD